MKISGNILKMQVEYDDVVHYSLPVGDDLLPMNELIGKELHFKYQGVINCIKCGRKIKKSFGQGYCYPCFIRVPETEDCVLRPELCKAHVGIARDLDFAREHCLIDHVVYLAVSSGLKVGVTRNTQIPNRWIDQGASCAIQLARTPNRYLAGTIEVGMKFHFQDKTNWRNMVTNNHNPDIDLVAEKQRAIALMHPDFLAYAEEDNSVTGINYPVLRYPQKAKSIGFDKMSDIKDLLTGIRGQYLLFDSGMVLNIRKHNGYFVEVEY